MSGNRRVKDVAEYLKAVSEIKAKWPNSTLVFRGHENESWPLASSAERRLKKSLPSQEEITDPFLEYNENLIKKCRLKNYDKREQKQLDDLELLADLQHHGAATCLIDFTRNALIALWFACKRSEYEEKNGKVFIVNTAEEKIFGEITHTNIKKSISDILQTRDTDQDPTSGLPTPETFALPPNKRSFWHWTPAHLNERITAQHSLFIFGLPSSEKLISEKIIIESASKEQIRKELEELHDICEESLFPDFVGFAYIQRPDAPYLTPDAEEYFRSGLKAQQRGQYSEAIQDFTKAIELKPDYAGAYAIRGFSYFYQGEYDRAVQDATKVIELKPDYAEAYAFRSSVYSIQGEYEHSIQDATKVIELKPDDAGAYATRGRAFRGQGEYDHAIQDFTKAIGLRPDYAEAYAFRGSVYSIQGEYGRAIQDATKVLELKADDAEAYAIRGLAYENQGKYDRVIQDLTKAIELKPDDAEAYAIRGRAYGNQGEYGRAIQDFTKKIELKPDHAGTYYARGLAWLHLKKWEEAKSDLIVAKDMEMDIVASFCQYTESVANFEQITGVKLPKDIAAMLTEIEN